MKRAIIIGMILIITFSFVSFVILNSNNSTKLPQPHLSNNSILYKSYNVTGTGKIKVKISENWKFAEIDVSYVPAEVKSGYVIFLNPAGQLVDNFTLTHRDGVLYSTKEGQGYNVEFYHLAGICTIEYNIVGDTKVSIQVRYIPLNEEQ